MKNQVYELKIKNIDCNCNDILKAISDKIDNENIKISRIEWVFFSQTLKYLLRSSFKGQTLSDLKKAKSEIEFLINSLSENEK